MSPLNRSAGYFLAGTDTGVGKTAIACGLVAAFRRRGLRIAAMKPVASGSARGREGLRNEDAQLLSVAAGIEVPYADINPYTFEPAIAPHLAAADLSLRIDIDQILTSFRRLAAQADLVIVEGVGGWEVPLNEQETSADLARVLDLPVILVVGLRLGCLNHALLTCRAIMATGLPFAGWMANHIDSHMPRVDDNISYLQRHLPAAYLGYVPPLSAPSAERVAQYLALPPLR